ncbi:MAG: TIGR03960 family B12-binding radical SAM protein [Clostridia bacterium]|nr:TIGR03960 family B12-binding radical SAM protein [Clostridia bacterium]
MDKLQWEAVLNQVQKPGRYTGGEMNSVMKNKKDVDVRFAFCFPDVYEIGMSHLGIKILYSALNAMDGVWCERVFAPWEDMETKMREHNLPLYALESKDALHHFDFIGFTMQYELSYTNVLNMLDLGGVELLAKNRKEEDPIVIIGGPCAYNSEPLADFVDIVSLGEGEEALCELMNVYREAKQKGLSRKQFLRTVADLPGFYVPMFYGVTYNEDHTIEAITPLDGVPAKITKRIIEDLDAAHYPDTFVVPYIEVVHDRAVQEIFRGCIRGCRFCQAGYVYRPVREKSPNVIDRQAHSLCDMGGYEELSLSSLSTSDYRKLPELLEQMLSWTEQEKINISLPSLRVDNFPRELMERIQSVRKSGLTFAPEAGTQRLRDVINKNITEEEVLRTAETAFSGGNTSVKLYFMMGLPTETLEDIEGIAALAQKVVNTFYNMPNKPKGKGVTVSASVSGFVPKPFTPFQWESQDTVEQLQEKQKHLVQSVTSRKISLSWHDAKVSNLEGIFARGDRRLAKVLLEAHNRGCKFDSWGEFFNYEKWMEIFADLGIDPAFYNARKREFDEVLPWSHIDIGVTKEFLQRENEKAHAGITTPHCREKCAGCGANRLCEKGCE